MSSVRSVHRVVLLASLALLFQVPGPARAADEGEPLRVHVPDADSVHAELLARFDPATDGAKRATDAAALVHRGEPCLTAFLQRVRQFSPEWSEEERERIRRLSPALEHAVAPPEHAARGRQIGAKAASMLPEWEDLTETLDGASCIVHYTLVGENAAPDQSYVNAIRASLDKAAKKLGKAFRPPIHEKADDGIDKLHVYVAKLQPDPTLGPVVGYVSFVQEVEGDTTGKQRTVFMALSNTMASQMAPGATLADTIKATCFHEYMHCVQAAYNGSLHRWALEGMAVWTEPRFAKLTHGIAAFFAGPSVFNEPEKPLWDESVRMYSTAPFFFYVDRTFRLEGGIGTFLEKAVSEDDPLAIFAQMAQDRGQTFDELFMAYIVDLHAGNLKGLRNSVIPSMSLAEAPVQAYGHEATGQVMKTGVQVHELDAQPGLPVTLLFSRVVSTGGGTAGAVVRHEIRGKKGKRLRLPGSGWEAVPKFGRGAPAAILVTNTDYAAHDAVSTSYRIEAFAPYLNVKRVVPPQGGVGPFETADIEVTYDLLGTPAGRTSFEVLVYSKAKAPGLDPVERFAFPSWTVGTDLMTTVQYTPVGLPPPQGTHRIKFIARTPGDSYGGEHAKSPFKVKVNVN